MLASAPVLHVLGFVLGSSELPRAKLSSFLARGLSHVQHDRAEPPSLHSASARLQT